MSAQLIFFSENEHKRPEKLQVLASFAPKCLIIKMRFSSQMGGKADFSETLKSYLAVKNHPSSRKRIFNYNF